MKLAFKCVILLSFYSVVSLPISVILYKYNKSLHPPSVSQWFSLLVNHFVTGLISSNRCIIIFIIIYLYIMIEANVEALSYKLMSTSLGKICSIYCIDSVCNLILVTNLLQILNVCCLHFISMLSVQKSNKSIDWLFATSYFLCY